MDWWRILYHCVIWVIAVVLFGVSLYAIVAIPMAIALLVLSAIYKLLKWCFPFLPSVKGDSSAWIEEISESAKPAQKRFNWGEKTEADKHRDLVEHIRIQQMNEERHRR